MNLCSPILRLQPLLQVKKWEFSKVPMLFLKSAAPTVGIFLSNFAHPWSLQLSWSQQLTDDQCGQCHGTEVPLLLQNWKLLLHEGGGDVHSGCLWSCTLVASGSDKNILCLVWYLVGSSWCQGADETVKYQKRVCWERKLCWYLCTGQYWKFLLMTFIRTRWNLLCRWVLIWLFQGTEGK